MGGMKIPLILVVCLAVACVMMTVEDLKSRAAAASPLHRRVVNRFCRRSRAVPIGVQIILIAIALLLLAIRWNCAP
jgi:hypothetical protein